MTAAVVSGLLATGVAVAPSASAAVPVVAKAAPAAALPHHGLTISGDLLTGTTRVQFLGSAGTIDDDVDAASFHVLNPKTLFVQVPADAVSGLVKVTTAEGSGVTPLPVTVLRAPVVDALSSAVAKGLDTVTVTGSWLGGKVKVLVAGKAATLVSPLAPAGSDATEVRAVVPKGLPGGPTSLVVSNEGGSTRRPFYVAPEVKAVAPAAGPTTGGAVAVVTGSGFTGTESVTFGGVAVPSSQLLEVSDKELVVRVPAGAVGDAPVVVTTRSGAQSAQSVPVTYRYQPVPVVDSVEPNWHPVSPPAEAGGPVVLTGKNLTETTSVLFGPTPVTPAVDLDAGTLTFTPPPSAKAAVVPITLVNVRDEVAHKTVVPFGYVGEPTVAKLAPATGPAGTAVVLSGTGFTNGTSVRFGGTAAACTPVSFVAVRCVVPAGTGTVPVSVTTPLGSAPSGAAPAVPFAYAPGVLPAPVVKKLVPAMGLPGSTVSLAGSELHLTSSVAFPRAGGGWVTATDVLVVGPARLVVRVPEGATSGALRLTPVVGSPATTGLLRYLAVARPSVTSVDAVGLPTLGVSGGDTVVLRGSGLTAGTTLPLVTVGGLPATVLKTPVPTAAAVAVKVPALSGRRAPVVVSTPFGRTTAQAELFYAPRVTASKLAAPLPDGRSAVLVSGLGFTGAHAVSPRLSAVAFGGVPATEVVVLSDKQLLAVSAPGSVLQDGVVVTTQHGTWTGTSQGVTTALTLPVPAVTSFSPTTAVLDAAPPQVTLTGTNLRADSVVAFGGTPGTVVSAAANGTSLVVVPPVRTTTSSVALTVTNDVNGEPYAATAADPFRYLPVPSLTSAAPTTGWTGSQQPDVTLVGRNLRRSTVVRFGAVQVPVTTAAPDGRSLTVSPPVRNETGPVDVTVTNFVEAEELTETLTGGYAYQLAVATVSGLSTTSAGPGTPVTLTGTSFVGVTSVRFGSTEVPFTVANAGTVFATVPVTPAGAYGSTVPVVVVNGTGQPSTGTTTWTWDSRPVLTGMSVSTAASGATITLTGSGFTGTTAVRFGSVLATSQTVVSDTTLQVVVPVTPSLGATANVSVTARGLVSPEPVVATANDWTWAPIAVVNVVSPSTASAGTTVTVTGRGFTPGQRVWVQVDSAVEAVASGVVVAPNGLSFTFTMPPKPSGNASLNAKSVRVTNTSGAVSTSDVGGSSLIYWQ